MVSFGAIIMIACYYFPNCLNCYQKQNQRICFNNFHPEFLDLIAHVATLFFDSSEEGEELRCGFFTTLRGWLFVDMLADLREAFPKWEARCFKFWSIHIKHFFFHFLTVEWTLDFVRSWNTYSALFTGSGVLMFCNCGLAQLPFKQ